MNGAQVASSISSDELKRLLDYGAKLVRVFIAWAGPIEVLNAWSPEQWRIHLIDEHTRLIETNLLPVFEQYPESRIVLNLLHPCGGFDADCRARCFGNDTHLQWWMFDAWNCVLRRVLDHQQCLVADLINEPAGEPDPVNLFYRNCATYIPGSRRIAVSPIYGSPYHMNRITLLGGRQCWYEPHIYQPLSFTHQGLDGRPPQKWSRQVERELTDALDSVRTWQRRTKKLVYIGEFGVSTFVPEADRVRYCELVLDACRRHDWHWTAHCFGRAANVWDIETPGVLRVMKRAWQ